MEKWLKGHENVYAVTDDGDFISYASGKRYLPKTSIRNGYKCVRVFHEDEVKTLKVGDLVASTFLGTIEYIFLDGDRSNTNVHNLCQNDDALFNDEMWIEGYEGLYSVTRTGKIYSFKGNLRRLLKTSKNKWNQTNACLVGEEGKTTVVVESLVSRYF